MRVKPVARVAIAAVVAGTAIVTAVGPAVAAASRPTVPSVIRESTPGPGGAGAAGGGTGGGLLEFGGATIDFVGRLIGTGGSGGGSV
ncbi:hypothetical protein OOK12_34585 [Streptomyces sp. NBC_00452]|uniref:hypothetical protein n=1 Tax=Streptomyces sp. NBC_00452 TaxID=2975746 RepID=UPI00225A3F63|nr:hypothetical protein [Streptomyces sp. NBC_00452]MCX5062080.1 hypothetical protein [Streptomyces sp. NBC_00452]